MTLFKILTATAAAALLTVGCVSIDNTLGSGMVPVSSTYQVITEDPIPISVSQLMADSLSGYSKNRITIGAVRKADEFGLTTRASVVTLVPLFNAKHDMGTNRVFKSMYFAVAPDSTSVEDQSQNRILQSVNVYELTRPLDMVKDFDCNGNIPHGTTRISAGTPIINGSDSLSFRFTKEYGSKYLEADKYFGDFKAYMQHFPGIWLGTDAPAGDGGRINIFDLQLGYDSQNGYVTGNYAVLDYSAEYDGERRDTSVLFYFSATNFYDLDSLSKHSGSGNFPQYCLNLTGHESAPKAGVGGAEVLIEGGGGLKPVVSAQDIRTAIIGAIDGKYGTGAHKRAIINRASLNFNYINDGNYDKMYKLPQILSPTCRIHSSDTTVTFMGLTDSSSSEENQGDRNLSKFTFNPDITYHAQELIGMEADNPALLRGDYDIWLLIMHKDMVTTTSSGNSDISDYYQYLAYQSYMSNMYGGYGGYGGYGYGGYGYGNSYTNYYNYAMLAQMYSQSTTSTSSQTNLDPDRYYYCRLYGPTAAETAKRPTLTFTYSMPN